MIFIFASLFFTTLRSDEAEPAYSSESVEAVMTKLEEIDFEGLNTAIKDLGDVVEPLAKFFGKFGK